jgi:hypothetical protein
MAIFSVRVEDELAARFDTVAAPRGGRSARLRQLIAQDAGAIARPAQPRPARRDGARIMVRLDAPETAAVDAEAAALSLSRAGWVTALVRRRVRGVPRFGRRDALALIAIQAELRRIGVNINQIARALNTAVLEGRVLDLELAAIAELQREQRLHLHALREAFVGNLADWEVDP